MAGESRRVELVNSVALPTESERDERPTVRISVVLTESTDVSSPEFSYTELFMKNSSVCCCRFRVPFSPYLC